MVRVDVLTNQLNKRALPPATEAKIRKLIGNSKTITKQQARILQDIIDDALRDISNIQAPAKTPNITTTNILTSEAIQTQLARLNIQSRINIFTTPIADKKLVKYQANINKIFNYGIQYTNKTPSSVVKQLQESVKQSSMEIITKLGDDYKRRAGQIVSDGLRNKLMPDEISRQLSEELKINRARADTIARTETMRAAHTGSYSQALRDGKKHYIVDNRAEACSLCRRSVAGRVFNINDTSFFPPIHPNCACIPVYWDDPLDAQRWADSLAGEKQEIRDKIIREGGKIKPDGTSQNTNN
jgi:SPP1 gp7 family putative phage head morphogenesis protein